MRSIYLLLIILFLAAKTCAQGYFNPYPLTCYFDSCMNALPDTTYQNYQMINYYYDSSHRMVRQLTYWASKYKNGKPLWDTAGHLENTYAYDSNNMYVLENQGPYYKIETKYDDKEHLSWIRHSSFDKQSQKWNVVYYSTFQHNAFGKITGRSIYADEYSEPPNKTFWTYDTRGRNIKVFNEQYNARTQTWENVYKYDSFPDANENDTAGRYYVWSRNKWRFINAATYTYNTKGQRLTATFTLCDTTMPGDPVSYYYRDSFTYYPDGDTLMRYRSSYSKPAWHIINTDSFSYYPDHHILCDASMEYNNNKPLPGTLFLTYYNEDGTIKKSGNNSITETFDDKGRLIRSINVRKGNIYSICTANYFYGSYLYTEIAQPKDSFLYLAVYPNPVSDNLYIKYQAEQHSPLTVSVYSAEGKKVLSGSYLIDLSKPLIELDTHSLAAGCYALIIQSMNSIQQVKFIKE